MDTNEQKNKNNENELYSYHIFSFPFILKLEELKKIFEEKTDINKQIELLGLKNWRYIECIHQNAADEYNKRVFFHPHVHDVIFSRNENEKKNQVVNFIYELGQNTNNKYIIEYLTEAKKKG